MSNFKIALTAVFALALVVGIGLFATFKSSSTQASNLVVWGTLDENVFNTAYRNSSLSTNKNIQISYIKKEASTFDSEFVEALANGAGPDIVILRDDAVYKNRTKIFTIPYTNYTERTFRDTFIPAGEVFLAPEGVTALPFLVDPLVMYWNRDLFTNNLIAQTPQYWDEVTKLTDKLTRRNSSGSVLQSAVALGEWGNVVNAKEIIATLLFQAGTPITSRGTNGVVSVLNSQFSYPIAPGLSAINFYTQFSNPTGATYTWNRSLPTSQTFFLSGNLAMYLGFASEIASIQQKNANLNFDVAMVPQIRGTAKKNTFAHMYAFALVKQSKQIPGAFVAVQALTEGTALSAVEKLTNLPPVSRALLATPPSDAFRVVFYNSALLSHSWIDPNAVSSSNTFRDMIESITSGRSRATDALGTANEQLNAQLR